MKQERLDKGKGIKEKSIFHSSSRDPRATAVVAARLAQLEPATRAEEEKRGKEEGAEQNRVHSPLPEPLALARAAALTASQAACA